MSTLIVFKSKYGTTEKSAQLLAGALKDDSIKVVDLKNKKFPDITGFDTVIIGGSIRMGIVHERVRKFCDKNMESLLTKKIGLFICCMQEDKKLEEFNNSYPEILRNHSTANGFFGGEFLFEKMNFIERLIVKKVAGVKQTVSKIDQEAIKEFAHRIQRIARS